MSEPLLMDPEIALGICERVLEASTAEQTEVNLLARRSGLTRFAENHIHQNVAETDARAIVRSAIGRRVGVAATNDTSDRGLRDVAERAALLASLSTPDEDFPGLPKPADEPAQVSGSPATAAFGPAERAEAVATCIDVARQHGQTAAGACSAAVTMRAVANSPGIRACAETTSANLRMIFAAADSSGYAEQRAEAASELAPRALAELAADTARRTAGPREVEAGRWDVILHPAAVADMLLLLASSAFNSLAWHEGRSPLCGRMGDRVCDESVTVWDDALDPRGLREPFDWEGVPTRRVELLTRGVAAGLVHDTRTAALQDARSTGHATPPSSGLGPVPAHLFMQPGEADVEEMIAAIERGLVVTRFHYTNLVDPRQATFTGMTRDGTFLIEGGEVVGGVRNLRFTESILDALSRVTMIGRQGVLCGRAWVPAVAIEGFRFTGVTEF